MEASPDYAGIHPADASAASELVQACMHLLQEMGGHITAAATMASALRLLALRCVHSEPDRMQLLSLRGETSRLLNSLDALLVDTHEPAASCLPPDRPLSSVRTLLEKLSGSALIRLKCSPELALASRESPWIGLPGSEAVIEQALIHLVQSCQPDSVRPVSIEAYLDSRQPGRPAQPGIGDLCFEVVAGFLLPACAERELACARALALSMGAELISAEYARRGDATVLKLRIPLCGFGTSKKSLRLLLVDDRRINQLVLADKLGACGHAVAVAGNAPKALELLGHQSFDAVLTDLNMPAMDGLELAKAIQASRNPASKPPVLLLVSEESPAILAQALAAGVSAIVRKHAGVEHILGVLAGQLPQSEPQRNYMPVCESSSTVH